MTKEITLRTGEIAIVDDEGYPVISRFSWKLTSRGYAYTTFKMSEGSELTVYMHKLIMGQGCYLVCDHVNNNPLDNRKENIRVATYQENNWNRGKPKAGRYGVPASKYKGVVRSLSRNGQVEWRVIIKLTKKGETPARHARLGPFATEVEAAMAYNEEIVKHRGEWAWLNPIPNEAA